MHRTKIYIPTCNQKHANLSRSWNIMHNAGMIRQVSNGLFAWLPLGTMVMDKVCSIISKHMDLISNKVIMPNLQPSDIWAKTGRLDAYGAEMLKIYDRNDNMLIYAPTHEEMIAEVIKMDLQTHVQLPINIYQINNKFRDEIRPCGGLLRSREFIMKDAYSVDINQETAHMNYVLHFNTYCNILNDLDINFTAFHADSGEMGGNLSHEFIAIAKNNNHENITCYNDIDKNAPLNSEILEQGIEQGIEICHTFYLGNKYAEQIGVNFTDTNNNKQIPEMGSYGIGIGRIIAAMIEYNEEFGIPKKLCPFDIGIVTLDTEDTTLSRASCIHDALNAQNISTIYDDRNIRNRRKFEEMSMIGCEHYIIVSNNNAHESDVEIKSIQTLQSEQKSPINYKTKKIQIENIKKYIELC